MNENRRGISNRVFSIPLSIFSSIECRPGLRFVFPRFLVNHSNNLNWMNLFIEIFSRANVRIFKSARIYLWKTKFHTWTFNWVSRLFDKNALHLANWWVLGVQWIYKLFCKFTKKNSSFLLLSLTFLFCFVLFVLKSRIKTQTYKREIRDKLGLGSEGLVG